MGTSYYLETLKSLLVTVTFSFGPVKKDSIDGFARDVIALLAKPLDVEIADQRYVNACKNIDSEDLEAHFQAIKELILCNIKVKC